MARGPARFTAVRANQVLVKALRSLLHALNAKDPYTAGHSLRVSVYARSMAKEMGLSDDVLGQVELGAEAHDIGKIGVSEHLLRKDGPLSDIEYRRVMEHTVIGERILEPLFIDRPTVLQIVRSHHERFDGRGGPDGLRGERIPLAARIVSVADSFDAMTSERPYRNAMDTESALEELRRNAGIQFDAHCVNALKRLVSADAAAFAAGLNATDERIARMQSSTQRAGIWPSGAVERPTKKAGLSLAARKGLRRIVRPSLRGAA